MKKIVAFISFFFAVMLCCFAEKLDVRSCIDNIPKEDRQILNRFFKHLVLRQGGYTLLGDKPLTDWFYVNDDWSFNDFLAWHSYSNYVLRKGWQTWLRYHHLFPSQKFILKGIERDSSSFEIALINREACLHAIKEHAALFQKRLHIECSCDEIFENYVCNLCIDDPLLLGILFGFGVENAKAFAQPHRPPAMQGFALPKSSCFDAIPPVHFACLPNASDTKRLQNQYKRWQRRIKKVFQKAEWLEMFLSYYTGVCE